MMSATKKVPILFGLVKSAIVELRTRERDRVGLDGRATVAHRISADAEREVPGTVPIESAGVCDQRRECGVAGSRSNNNIPHGDSNRVEFEVLLVRRTGLYEGIPGSQGHVEVNARSVLGKGDRAKGRGSSAASDMVAGKVEANRLGRRWLELQG